MSEHAARLLARFDGPPELDALRLLIIAGGCFALAKGGVTITVLYLAAVTLGLWVSRRRRTVLNERPPGARHERLP